MRYQQIRMPAFGGERVACRFETNLPVLMERLLLGLRPPMLKSTPTTVEVRPQPHGFKTETEFNLRRVSYGYSAAVNDVCL